MVKIALETKLKKNQRKATKKIVGNKKNEKQKLKLKPFRAKIFY